VRASLDEEIGLDRITTCPDPEASSCFRLYEQEIGLDIWAPPVTLASVDCREGSFGQWPEDNLVRMRSCEKRSALDAS
jgi:hypothetical protein